MSYTECLKEAGAIVHREHSFGSYQGEWIAEVTLPSGVRGYIKAGYGSCSGCDAFEAELGGDYHTCDGATDYHDKRPDTCTQCADYAARRKKFGEGYFEDCVSREALEKELVTSLRQDYGDESEMVAWLYGWSADGDEIRAYVGLHGVVLP